MNGISMLQMDSLSWELPALAGLLGLMVGSFLNVVVYRLPLMLERSWRRDCEQFLHLQPLEPPADPFNLARPRSHCIHCGALIPWWNNLPVISYVLLRGRCGACKAAIAWRYPALEFITSVLSVIVVWRFDATLQASAGLLLTWTLLALSVIDLEKQLLPDCITLPMLWLGLLSSVFDVYADSHSSIVGAAMGYLSLWLVYWLFKGVTGKEGMGYGDFKLLALLGAWLGWSVLPWVILMSSLSGAVVGGVLMLLGYHQRGQPMPFGPFIALAGWVVLVWGAPYDLFVL